MDNYGKRLAWKGFELYMSDFTSLTASVNAGSAVTDASPSWNVTNFATANYELRLCGTGAGAGNIASASWPTYLRPGSVGVIPEMWVYLGSDNSGGLQVKTYDGTSAHYMQFRIAWDNTGTFAAQNILSFWKDTSLPAASPGTQPSATSGGDGSSFVNGANPDTGTSPVTSYIKGNAYGSGVTAAGAQETPAANASGTLAATTGGNAGAYNTTAGAWQGTWTSMQAATSYIQSVATPKATTSGFWYFLLAFYTGPGMTGGTLLPQLGLQYQWV